MYYQQQSSPPEKYEIDRMLKKIGQKIKSGAYKDDNGTSKRKGKKDKKADDKKNNKRKHKKKDKDLNQQMG